MRNMLQYIHRSMANQSMHTNPADVSVHHERPQSYVMACSLNLFSSGSQIRSRRIGIEARWLGLQLYMSRASGLEWWALSRTVCGQRSPLLQESLSSADHERELIS